MHSICSGAIRAALAIVSATAVFGCEPAAIPANRATAPSRTALSQAALPQAAGQARTVFIEEGKPLPNGADKINLPAWRTQAEYNLLGKPDQYDDFRAEHKEWYAQTAPPPAGQYRPFAEWEPMQAIWTVYSSGMPGTKPVRRMFAEQTIAFVRHSKIKVEAIAVVSNTAIKNDFLKALDEYGITAEEKEEVVMVIMPNQTIWHIDYGPFPLVDKADGHLAFTDYVYYPPRTLDDAMPTRIGRDYYKDITTYRMPFPFEGGNIQSDGVGICVTSERALSNTGFSVAKVRNLLKKYNACETTWVIKDITDDGTGHIDMFFKWSQPNEIIMGEYHDTIDVDYDGDGEVETLAMAGAVAPNYKGVFALNKKRMNDNAAFFAAQKGSNGEPIKVHRLTMMTRFRDSYGDLPRTFINSTFASGVNAYPSYTTKSCRDPDGAGCMLDTECADTEYCSVGHCTAMSPDAETIVGCDEIVGCAKGTECVDDPIKVKLAATAQLEWEAAMPDWKHVGLRADTIGLWSGAIHCITRNIPVGALVKDLEDGLCIGGQCACIDDGAKQSCDYSSECFGPAYVCDCNICKGQCPNGSLCTDDADCASDENSVVAGDCNIDPRQACKGKVATGCGDVPDEGLCQNGQLKFCEGTTVATETCGDCCGFGPQDARLYSCLGADKCAACQKECEVGQTGCSAKLGQAWTCVDDDGCLKRKWSICGNGKACNAKVGACEAVDNSCPAGWGGDPIDEDAGGSDDGGAGDDGGGADAIAAGDTATGGGGGGGGGGGDDSSCTAAPGSSGGSWPLFALFGIAGMAVLGRRRRA